MPDAITTWEQNWDKQGKYLYEKKPLNIDLIDTVISFVEQNEQLHEQAHYMDNNGDALCPGGTTTPQGAADKLANVCGSTGCIAGWGALIAGWCQIRNAGDFCSLDEWWESATDDVVDPSTGVWAGMALAAQYEFGMSHRQASAMFDGGNTLSDIKEMVEALRADPNADLSGMTTLSKKYASDG